MKTTCIINNYNYAQYVEAAIQSVLDQTVAFDEIVVVDSGSTDNTLEIARNYGADVYEASDILPHLENFIGKGENLWKALPERKVNWKKEPGAALLFQ